MVDPPWIKVCGLTREADVEQAEAGGANLLGFVHYPRSPRGLSLELAAELMGAAAADATTVLVVVNAAPSELTAWIRQTGARAVQLCGAEQPADFADFDVPILRRVGVDDQAGDEIEAWRQVACAFVLDHPSAPGGTGQGVDLELAAELAAQAPCLLAGGLDGGNLEQRAARVRPAGVDAASRIEARPGIKDPEALTAYLSAARRALHSPA